MDSSRKTAITGAIIMKRTIEQQLIDSRPESHIGATNFVAKTMTSIKSTEAAETFEKAVRTESVTNKERFSMKIRNLKIKFTALPRFAAVAVVVGSTGTVGAAAYATYQWFTPKVTITNVQQANDESKKEYTIDSQCGEFNSGKSLHYELQKDSKLTDDDVYKVFKNTCAYDALHKSIGSRFIADNDHDSFAKKKVGDTVTQYEYDNTFAGYEKANHIFGLTIGHVTQITATSVTIEAPLYSIDNSLASAAGVAPSKLYYSNGKVISRTLPIASDTVFAEQGKTVQSSDIVVGNTVQLVVRTRNLVKYYSDIHQNGLGPETELAVAGIYKNDIDLRYVAGSGAGIGDPTYTEVLSGLLPCYGNAAYYCTQVPNQVLGIVYQNRDETGEHNLKYYRTDSRSEKVQHYELAGRVTKISGKTVTIETRGRKATAIITLPYDAVAEYNKPKVVTNERQASEALRIEVGDLVSVNYSQTKSEDHLAVQSMDIETLSVIEQFRPDGSIAKY
jgi:hypothetical protein